MTVLILHGINASAGDYWQSWLADKLKQQGHQVLMPQLPNAHDPDRDEWLQTIQATVEDVNLPELTIVGHSLGVASALDFVQSLPVNSQIQGLISVAGFHRAYGFEPNEKFMSKWDINLDMIKR